MSTEENKAVVRRFLEEVLDARDVGAADSVLDPDCTTTIAGVPDPLPDLAAWKQVMGLCFAAFPDMRFSLEDLVAEGDRVAARYTWRGTHQEPLMGLPPSGRPVSVAGMGLYRLAGGKIVESHVQEDLLGLMQQLGMAPAPAAG